MSDDIKFPSLLSDLEYQKMSAQEKETHIKEILRNTLVLNQHGVTISQLKQGLPFDRRIIEKHLDVMKFTNELYTVHLGSNILYIPNHKAMHEVSSQSARFGNYEYQVFMLRNRLGDYMLVQQRNISKESQEITGGLQIPLEHYDNFVAYLQRTMTDMERRSLK